MVFDCFEWMKNGKPECPGHHLDLEYEYLATEDLFPVPTFLDVFVLILSLVTTEFLSCIWHTTNAQKQLLLTMERFFCSTYRLMLLGWDHHLIFS